MTATQLYQKINYLPSDLKSEVIDFIDYLLSKQTKKQSKKQPKFGCAKGQFIISPDFDSPLDDFKEYME